MFTKPISLRPYSIVTFLAVEHCFSTASLFVSLRSNSVSQLDVILSQVLSFMTRSLQRQLGYMNTDGSFSMFRDYRRHTPSLWLTSFVLEAFSSANEADWILEFYVSSDLLNKIALYLTSQQHPSGKAMVNRSYGSCVFDKNT